MFVASTDKVLFDKTHPLLTNERTCGLQQGIQGGMRAADMQRPTVQSNETTGYFEFVIVTVIAFLPDYLLGITFPVGIFNESGLNGLLELCESRGLLEELSLQLLTFSGGAIYNRAYFFISSSIPFMFN